MNLTRKALFVSALALFLFVLPAMAFIECPCGVNPPFKCCGDVTCNLLVWNAISSGHTCRPQPLVYCCPGQDGPNMTPIEGADGIAWTITYPNGDHFDGLRNGKAVQLRADGVVVDRGQFEEGYITFQHMGKYMVLAGDLFLME